MINASDRLKYILRLIILLDSDNETDVEVRQNKAVRNFGQETDLDLFDQYVLGGVEVLYEKLIVGATRPMDYVDRLYNFLEEFNDRFNAVVTREEILDLCQKAGEY